MNEATREDWKVSKLPNGYWQVNRPDGSQRDEWKYFHDKTEALEFARLQSKVEAGMWKDSR